MLGKMVQLRALCLSLLATAVEGTAEDGQRRWESEPQEALPVETPEEGVRLKRGCG